MSSNVYYSAFLGSLFVSLEPLFVPDLLITVYHLFSKWLHVQRSGTFLYMLIKDVL